MNIMKISSVSEQTLDTRHTWESREPTKTSDNEITRIKESPPANAHRTDVSHVADDLVRLLMKM